MQMIPGELCEHDLCEVCGSCHERGCFCQRAMCDRAREDAVFDVADTLGFTIRLYVSGEVVFLKWDDEGEPRIVASFQYTHEGMVQAEFWLRGLLFDGYAQHVEAVMAPPSLWETVKRVVRNALRR